MKSDKIEVPREYIDRLLYKLMELQMLSNDMKQKDNIGLIIDFVEKVIVQEHKESLNLEDLIYDKMIEARGVNDQLNARLYMLYQDLVNNKISREKAKDLLELYLHME